MAGEALPAATQRVIDLARGDRRHGQVSGCLIRVAFAPIGAPHLLDATTLDQPGLGDRVARISRDCGVVSQAAGLNIDIRADGVKLSGTTPQAWVDTTVLVAPDGSVCVEADVQSEGMLGGSAISHDKVHTLVGNASNAAQDLWSLTDHDGRVRQVAATLGVPDAAMKVYALLPIGNSMSMSMSTPDSIVSPDPPLVLRRSDVGTNATSERLVTALKRTFMDLGAVHDR